MISINKNRATTPALSSVLFELGDRAMPTKTLCPKSHGQRTITCPVCNGSGGTCFAEVVVGICGNAMEAANVAATFAAVHPRLSPRHFNGGAPSTTPPMRIAPVRGADCFAERSVNYV